MARYLDNTGLQYLWNKIKLKFDEKADAIATVSDVIYDTRSKRLNKIIGGTSSEVVDIATIKADLALTKADVGLDLADNTPDSEKNVATSITAQALTAKTVRPATANEMHENTHRLNAFLASSLMQTGKPPVDSHVLHFNWYTGTEQTGTRDSQLAIASAPNAGAPGLYYRTQKNGTWSNWIPVYSEDYKPTFAAVGLENVDNLHQKALHGGTALTRGANLDGVTTVGNYYAATNAIAASLYNCPTNVMFHMYVGLSNGASTGYEYQEIISYETGYRYYRARRGSEEAGWSDWVETAQYDAGTGLTLEDHAFHTSVNYVNTTSNRLSALGKNRYILEEYASGSEGLPNALDSFIMLTAAGDNSRNGVQLALDEYADGVYYRRIYSNNYADWKPLLYSAEGGGIALNGGAFSNTGVHAVVEGNTNGTIAVTTNGVTSAVPVHGLGSRAFDSTDYVPLAGRATMTDYLSVRHEGQAYFSVENNGIPYTDDQGQAQYATHKIGLTVSDIGTSGLYDFTLRKWPLFWDTAGNATFRGNADTATSATSADKVRNSLTLRIKSGSTNGTSRYIFDGSAAQGLNFLQGENVTLTAGTGTMTIAAKDTTYTAGTGLALSNGVFSNTGVRTIEITSGTTNGTIAYRTNDATGYTSVSVYGLGSAAYTESADYATYNHTHYYAGSSTVGGAANSVASNLVLTVNSGTSEGTSKYTFNGGTEKYLDFLAGDGVTLTPSTGTMTITNAGVRAIETGTTNGTISVNTNGRSANVAVQGLGSAAFTPATNYVPITGTASTNPITGNVQLEKAGAISISMNNTNVPHKIELRVYDTFAGIFDSTLNQWLMNAKTDGTVRFLGTATRVWYDHKLKINSGSTEGTDLYTYNGSNPKTLDIKQGANTTLTAGSGSLTVASSNVYLRAGTSTSTENAATTTGNTYLNLVQSDTRRSGVKLAPGEDMTITSNDSGTVTFTTKAIREYSATIATSAWVTTTDGNIRGLYGYQASITVNGVTANQIPDVVFIPSEALEWELAPICKSAANAVIVYARIKPTSAVNVLSIRCF